MFVAKTPRIQKLAELFPEIVKELEGIFNVPTNVYIDWQNVIHWQNKLGWHIDAKRLKQFFDSFDTVKCVSLYTGTLNGDQKSLDEVKEFKSAGYKLETKPVKIMPYSINVSSIPANSPVLLEPFIKKPFLKILSIEMIEKLNHFLDGLNKQGVFNIIDKKCNFDVEIGRDMFLDLQDGNRAECFILWSGDSDFVDPINAILKANKKIFLFATAGRISTELSQLKVPVFDIKKIKEFICFPKELPDSVKNKLL